jgi:hypothetical protein
MEDGWMGKGWLEDSIKGRIAEEIVCHMFRKNGYIVIPSGKEKVFPSLIQKNVHRTHYGYDAGEQLKTLPDFIVLKQMDEGDRLVSRFVEVKFSSKGDYGLKENRYKCFVIFVINKEPYFLTRQFPDETQTFHLQGGNTEGIQKPDFLSGLRHIDLTDYIEMIEKYLKGEVIIEETKMGEG